MAINEAQKPFNKQGRLNAELITRKSYCGVAPLDGEEFCNCDHCKDERDDLKCQVNKLMGRQFYEEV